MKVKEAVKTAINHIQDLFESENLSNLGLEEVQFDDAKNQWVITVGFSRPWNYPSQLSSLATLGNKIQPKRDFKIVRVNSQGDVIEVKNRESGE